MTHFLTAATLLIQPCAGCRLSSRTHSASTLTGDNLALINAATLDEISMRDSNRPEINALLAHIRATFVINIHRKQLSAVGVEIR